MKALMKLSENFNLNFAGLDPSVYESGKFRSTHNSISKRGSTHLRKALYQAASAGIRKTNEVPNNPILYNYYSKKVNEEKTKKLLLLLQHISY